VSGATPEKFFGVTMQRKEPRCAPPAGRRPPRPTGRRSATSENTAVRGIVPAVNVSFGIGVALSLATEVRRRIETVAETRHCAAHHSRTKAMGWSAYREGAG
jgi:hypothetical protein